MKPLVIFGTGKFAEMVHYYFTHDSSRAVAGFTVDREYLKETQFCGLPVVPFDEVEKHFPPQDFEMILCIGYSSLLPAHAIAPVRKAKFTEAKKKTYALASYISSKTVLWPNNHTGENVIIIEQNFIQPFAAIGDNTMVCGGCTISHHTMIGNHCFLSPGVTIAGITQVGEGSFIGTGAVLGPYLSVGEYNVIGAGVTLLKSTDNNQRVTAI